MKYKPLSREFLLKRGYCCDNGCKNCPYKTTKMDKVKNYLYNIGSLIKLNERFTNQVIMYFVWNS